MSPGMLCSLPRRARAEGSIFHARYYASSDGNLLNQNKIYDNIMSAEEVFTYSADIKSATNLFNSNKITKDFFLII